MKSVLISIQPKWCELIASGKKTVEVRKSVPKLETPFKCYIYQSYGKKRNSFSRQIQKYFNQGKVIGEFVCDRVDVFQIEGAKGVRFKRFSAFAETCMTVAEMREYAGNKPKLFGWHISNLKIYDTPKEFSEFWTRSNHPDCDQCAHVPVGMNAAEFVWHNDFCGECRRLSYKSMWATHFRKKLTRPPQSWCRVEELK